MVKEVVKRDGTIVPFDADKIRQAVYKAMDEVGYQFKVLVDSVVVPITRQDRERMTVEEIQDEVETLLIKCKMVDVAKAYIRYRYKRELVRSGNTTDKTIKELLDGTSEYWNTENSNKNAKIVTVQRDYLAGITSTDIAKRFLLPKDVVEAHEQGIIHQHDMDYMAQNSLNNCFDGSTKFVTDQGVRRFDSFHDGDQVKVKDKDGVWRTATVRTYGKQPMYDVTFRTDGQTKTITCTRNHRWILKDGTVTTSLQEGNILAALPASHQWKVEEIRPHFETSSNHPMLAWCVEEPITHSFTLDGDIVTGNCGLINLEDMLMNGTVVNGVTIDAQHRLLTATTVATQIIAAVASSQYGGCTVTLSHLAPFVRMSYESYINEGKELFSFVEDEDQREAKIKEYANLKIAKEVKDSVQTFNYQVNSMATTNGQAPFLSVFMWIDEDPEYEKETVMLIEEFLRQRIKGMKNEVGVYITQAFPKLLYCLDENNTEPDSKYYWLTKLAAKSTAKRMNPDYISAKIMREQKIDKFGNGNVYPCIN